MKKNIILIITIILLIASIGLFGYLFFENKKLEQNVLESKENIKKVEEKINSDKKEIDKKEDEYEKLKEEVKENFEELSIWEETKEKLEKALS